MIQPHHLRPVGTVDVLTGKVVDATNKALGAELPCVDLRQDFSKDDFEVLKQASDDAGGVLSPVLKNRQSVVNRLVDVGVADNANNAAHLRILELAKLSFR